MFPGLLPPRLERPQGVLGKPTPFSGASRPFPSQETWRRFTFLGMGLPRWAPSSSVCRPRCRKGNGSQGKASAWGLQGLGTAGDWAPGPRPPALPGARPQKGSQHSAIWTWSCKWKVHGSRSDQPPPPIPRGSDSDLYPWELMGQPGYDLFSV